METDRLEGFPWPALRLADLAFRGVRPHPQPSPAPLEVWGCGFEVWGCGFASREYFLLRRRLPSSPSLEPCLSNPVTRHMGPHHDAWAPGAGVVVVVGMTRSPRAASILWFLIRCRFVKLLARGRWSSGWGPPAAPKSLPVVAAVSDPRRWRGQLVTAASASVRVQRGKGQQRGILKEALFAQMWVRRWDGGSLSWPWGDKGREQRQVTGEGGGGGQSRPHRSPTSPSCAQLLPVRPSAEATRQQVAGGGGGSPGAVRTAQPLGAWSRPAGIDPKCVPWGSIF